MYVVAISWGLSAYGLGGRVGITFGRWCRLRIQIADAPIRTRPTIAAATAIPIVAPCDSPSDFGVAVVSVGDTVWEVVEVVLPGRAVEVGRSVDCQLIWIRGAKTKTFCRTARVVELDSPVAV
jgi:hypothetical protein